MERYTYFEGGKWRLRAGDTEHSGPWVDRLAAYEDTGLEPEEVAPVMELAEKMNIVDLVRETLRMANRLRHAEARLNSLSTLVKARDEGRVVVLQGDYTDVDGEEALRRAMYYCGTTNNPVTRYTADAIAEKLTRAEAGAAIGGGGDSYSDAH